MATELEQAVKRLNQALENASEEERAEFLGFNQELLEKPEKKMSRSRTRGWKVAFEKVMYCLGLVGLFLLRLLIIIVKAPFFIISLIKNWIFLGIGLWIVCYIGFLVYSTFIVGDYSISAKYLSNEANLIIIWVAFGIALIGTIGQYSGRVDFD